MNHIDIKSARDYFVKIKIEIFSSRILYWWSRTGWNILMLKILLEIYLYYDGASNIPGHLIIMFDPMNHISSATRADFLRHALRGAKIAACPGDSPSDESLPIYPQDSSSWSWYSSPSPATSWCASRSTPTAGCGGSATSSWPPWPSPTSSSVGWWWPLPESTISLVTGSSGCGSATSGSPSMLCAALPLSWIYAPYRSIVTYTSRILSGEAIKSVFREEQLNNRKLKKDYNYFLLETCMQTFPTKF